VKELEDKFDTVVPGAAGRGGQFLGVLQKRCQQEGLGINLRLAERPRRTGGGVILKADVKASRDNVFELEVFADDMGSSLHVGWEVRRTYVGGSVLGNVGMFGAVNAGIERRANKVGSQRAQSGLMQAFHLTVFMPVAQQLVDAVQVRQGQNGFLGA
jgi:hypothetical protein